MNVERVRKLGPGNRLAYWIVERENIRLKKEAGIPKPWTDDEILQSYRFCNVVRMDDKVSRWLYQNWYRPYKDHRNMLAAVALARFINNPDSLDRIGGLVLREGGWKPGSIISTLRKYREAGGTVFNGAYMVRGNDGIDKIECVVDYYVRPLVKYPPAINTDSMEETWKEILPYYGWGSFMAGQVVADLRWALSGGWEDKEYWAPAGPGSCRGMHRFFDHENIKGLFSPYEFVQNLLFIRRTLSGEIPDLLYSRMEAHDWQNCLCEFDKYERALWGEGKPKQKYPGGNNEK